MPRLLYSLAFYLAIPFVLLRLLYRSIREPDYRAAIGERFGWSGAQQDRPIWIHAVSAGETIAATPLVKQLLEAGHPCLVTNMTPTGRERARTLLGDAVQNCYAPYDLPDAVGRFIATHRPKLMITIDTELWPNTVATCHRMGVPTMLANGRLSQKSATGYSRLSGLVTPMLKSIDRFAVQSQAHAGRFIGLGVEADRVTVTGSIKFDNHPRDDIAERVEIASQLSMGRPILLGASTHEGEEAALLRSFKAVQDAVPDALLVLAPRHTHRLDQVIASCRGESFEPVLFTSGNAVSASDAVLIIDTMGELDAFYDIASVAFVGGSLVPVGGHNLLEAVVAGTPVVMGSYLRNIEDIAQQFIDAKGMRVVHDQVQLDQTLVTFMTDSESRDNLSSAATSVFELNQGALSQTMNLIMELLPDG